MIVRRIYLSAEDGAGSSTTGAAALRRPRRPRRTAGSWAPRPSPSRPRRTAASGAASAATAPAADPSLRRHRSRPRRFLSRRRRRRRSPIASGLGWPSRSPPRSPSQRRLRRRRARRRRRRRTDVELETAKKARGAARGLPRHAPRGRERRRAHFAKFKIGRSTLHARRREVGRRLEETNPTHLKPSAVVPRDGRRRTSTAGAQRVQLLRVVAGGADGHRGPPKQARSGGARRALEQLLAMPADKRVALRIGTERQGEHFDGSRNRDPNALLHPRRDGTPGDRANGWRMVLAEQGYSPLAGPCYRGPVRAERRESPGAELWGCR